MLLILFLGSIDISGSTQDGWLNSLKNLNVSSFKRISITKRDLKFYFAGNVSPVVLLLFLVPFVLQMPWYPRPVPASEMSAELTPWSYYYQEAQKINVGDNYNVYKFEAKSTKPLGEDDLSIYKTKRFSKIELWTGQECAILFACGVGDTPALMPPAIHSQLLPTSHFYVVGLEDFEKKRLLARSLGQDSEIIPLIYALMYLVKEGYEKIIVVGESAGGAMAINIVPILQNPQHQLWGKISLPDDVTQKGILEKLKIGGIWLRAPLLSVKHLAHPVFAPLVKYIIAPILTQFRFNPFKKEPVDAILDWQQDTNIPVLFTPSKTDEVLGQKPNKDFFDRLKGRNGNDFSFEYHYAGTHIQSFTDTKETEDVGKKYPQVVHNFLTTGKID